MYGMAAVCTHGSSELLTENRDFAVLAKSFGGNHAVPMFLHVLLHFAMVCSNMIMSQRGTRAPKVQDGLRGCYKNQDIHCHMRTYTSLLFLPLFRHLFHCWTEKWPMNLHCCRPFAWPTAT